MFKTEYYHSLDPKGRLIIPQKFREELGESFVLARGIDKCLVIYTKEGWKAFEEKLTSLPTLSNPNARKVTRFFLAGAQDMEVDGQGRILIPIKMREFAGLSKNVVLAGVGDRIEVWDQTRYEEYSNFDDVDALANSLAEYGI